MAGIVVDNTTLIKKEDARVYRTKRDLADALEALLNERNFDDLSVKDITDQALISKNTFYNNFQDKNELLQFVFTRYLLKIKERINPLLKSYKPYPLRKREFFKKVIKEIVDFFLDDMPLPMGKMAKNDISGTFFRDFSIFTRQAMEHMVAEYPFLLGKTLDEVVLINFYSGGIANLIYYAYRNELQIERKKICSDIFRLVYPALCDSSLILG